VGDANVGSDRDDDSGKFTEQYPTEAFLDAVASIDNATTSKVAEKVGCSYDLAYRRLHSLADDGKVVRTKVGGILMWSPVSGN